MTIDFTFTASTTTFTSAYLECLSQWLERIEEELLDEWEELYS